MPLEDDFDRGLKNRRAVLGDAWVDRSLDNATAFNAEFQALITRYAWHEIWGRPGLNRTTRRLLVLAITAGLSRWEEFELHCRAAVRASREDPSVTLAQIQETLMQVAIYAGVPAANTGFKIAQDILREEGLLPAVQPLSAGARVATHHTFSQPQLKVTLQGQGSPVVLSHALGLDLQMWDALAAELAPRHQVLRYDHRGHGGSAVPPGPYSMDDLVDDAARLIREWGVGPVAFVGLSLGGMVGQGLAIRHPELVRALVLANTTSRYPQAGRATFEQRIDAVRQGGLASIADGAVERFFGADFRQQHPETVMTYRHKLLRTDAAGYAAACQAVRDVDWYDRLSEIRCPTLVIAGANDVGTPPEMAHDIAERIENAELVEIGDAAHLSAVEQPGAFAEQIQRFLEQAESRAG